MFSSRGQPAEAPWRVAIVVVLQYVEGLTDREAAEAMRGRLDWKYALGLELSDPGCDASVLSEFRERLVTGQAETVLLNVLLERCKQRGWLKAGGTQRTDSTHVLARARSLSNLECVGETLRATLDDVARVAPDWLASHITPDWFERYRHRVENYHFPKAESQRTALAEQIGRDGVCAGAATGVVAILRSLERASEAVLNGNPSGSDTTLPFCRPGYSPKAATQAGMIASTFAVIRQQSRERYRVRAGLAPALAPVALTHTYHHGIVTIKQYYKMAVMGTGWETC